MSPHEAAAATSNAGFPRVSGDEPRRHAHSDASAVFSPRERG